MTRNSRLVAGVVVLLVVVAGVLLLMMWRDVNSQPIADLFQDRYQTQTIALNGRSTRQVTVSGTIPYPGEIADAKVIAALRTMGWEKCSGPNAEWESILQDPGPVLLHQRTLYFQQGFELLVMYAKYESKGDVQTLKKLDRPGNDRQVLTILHSNEGPLLWLKKRMLGVECP